MRLIPRRSGWFRGGLHARRNPYMLMLVLAMASSSIFFFFLLAMLVARKVTVGFHPIVLPDVFYLSTVIIGLSSYTITVARRHFKAERYRDHLNLSGFTIILGLLFIVLQLYGCYRLYRSGFRLEDSAAGAFVYLLTGMHFLHMLIALVMLGWATLDSSRSQGYIDGYLQSLDPARRTRLKLAYAFWHFTDVLWLVLLAVFSLLLAR